MKDGHICSFDIFDTVLTRVWARPVDLFLYLGQRLKFESATFRELRVNSEIHARRRSGLGEVTLHDIYQEMGNLLGWQEDQIREAIRIELETENASLVPVPEMVALIEHQQKDGAPACFISDIYLPESIIRDWLIARRLFDDRSVLYTSSQHRETKHTGRLFTRVLADQRLKPEQILHTGDNPRGDVLVPKGLGIRTRHFTATKLNRYEQLLADCPKIPPEQRSLAAGIARLTRLNGWNLDCHRRVIWELGADVIGPVFFSYVLWCLRKASSEGLRRLYFIARDGQILCRIAQTVAQALEIPIDCHYLYGSRQAWHLPGVGTLQDRDLDWILLGTHRVDLYTIFRRVNLTPDRVRSTLEEIGFPESSWKDPLDGTQIDSLRPAFLRSPIKDEVENEAATAREFAAGYLRQEGFGDGVASGIVDLGWRGTMQRSLDRVLAASNIPSEAPSRGFYFHVSPRHPIGRHERFFSYLEEIGFPPGRGDLWYSEPLMEVFAAADHGGTRGYRKQSGRFTPILSCEEDTLATSWGIRTLQDSAHAFAERFIGILQEFGLSAVGVDSVVPSLLSKFVEQPTKAEADAFGCLPVNSDQASERAFEMAPRLSTLQCLRYIFFDIRSTGEAWTQGIAARSWVLPRMILRMRQSVRSFRRKLEDKIGRYRKPT